MVNQEAGVSTEVAAAEGRAAQMPAPAQPSARPALSGRQKAAIIVRLLLAEGASLPLSQLPEEIQAELARQMASLRYVDHDTLRAVIEEFLDRFETTGLSFPGALDKALNLLDGTISSAAAARLRREAGLALYADPWERISGLDAEALKEVLERESIEVGAVILSKLKVSKAAEVLGLLPGETARRITYAVSLTGNVSPQVVHRIGLSIAEQLDAQPQSAFADGPVERVGAILNFSPAATREEMLEGLEQADSGFAEQVRRAIFTFANIPARIDPRDIPRITREVDPAQLVTALAHATAAGGPEAEAAEFILASMSQRMAGQLREEMEARGQVKPKDGEAAMTAVVAAIRTLEEAGEILLVAEDE